MLFICRCAFFSVLIICLSLLVFDCFMFLSLLVFVLFCFVFLFGFIGFCVSVCFIVFMCSSLFVFVCFIYLLLFSCLCRLIGLYRPTFCLGAAPAGGRPPPMLLGKVWGVVGIDSHRLPRSRRHPTTPRTHGLRCWPSSYASNKGI